MRFVSIADCFKSRKCDHFEFGFFDLVGLSKKQSQIAKKKGQYAIFQESYFAVLSIVASLCLCANVHAQDLKQLTNQDANAGL